MPRLRHLLLLSAVPLAMGAGCSRNPDPDRAPAGGTLPREAADGWRPLFDGRTLAGWRGYRRAAPPAGWQVVDGALTRVAEGGDLMTNEE
ncbi:MAG: family 16 glycoside hydrolase, partial [Longimicrobiaceae bacterium]